MSSPAKERQLKDPYRLDPTDIATPPRRLSNVLRHLGPGLITAAAIVGSGELIATTVLGAENGYLLLWLILVSCPVKIFVLHEIGRYTIATGETSLEAFNRVPGPRVRVSWVVWLYGLLILCALFPQGGMMGAISEILHIMFPSIPLTGWLWVLAVLTFFLLAEGSYGPVEKIALGLVVAFTTLTVGCAIVLFKSPEYFSWSRVLEGLSFSLPQGGFGTAVTVFGVTGAGSMELIQYPYLVYRKGLRAVCRSAGSYRSLDDQGFRVDPGDERGRLCFPHLLYPSDDRFLPAGRRHPACRRRRTERYGPGRHAVEHVYRNRGMHFTPDYPTSCGWPVRLPRRCWTISE